MRNDVTVRERTDLSLAVLRLRGGDAALPRLAEVVGCPLPREPNATQAIGATRACWLAPDEWLLIGESAFPIARLSEACGGILHHVCDVTDGRVAFELSGPAAREVIAGACSLDLHDRAFPSDRCAQSLFAQVAVFIVRRGDSFTLIADASYAGHLRAWLADAALA